MWFFIGIGAIVVMMIVSVIIVLLLLRWRAVSFRRKAPHVTNTAPKVMKKKFILFLFIFFFFWFCVYVVKY
jgi:hypothetical protein